MRWKFQLVFGLAALFGAGLALPSAAQVSPGRQPLIFLSRGGNTLVMMTDIPTRPATGRVEVWVWYFYGPDHPESSERGPLTRAVNMTIDCSTRMTSNHSVENFNGLNYEGRVSLTHAARWVRPANTSIGAAPIKAACDPAPTAPRPVLENFQAARAGADRALLIPPTS